jgi:hypothetical protein
MVLQAKFVAMMINLIINVRTEKSGKVWKADITTCANTSKETKLLQIFGASGPHYHALLCKNLLYELEIILCKPTPEFFGSEYATFTSIITTDRIWL